MTWAPLARTSLSSPVHDVDVVPPQRDSNGIEHTAGEGWDTPRQGCDDWELERRGTRAKERASASVL